MHLFLLQTWSVTPSVKKHGYHKPVVEKPIKGVTKKDLRNKSTRDFNYQDIPGSTSYECKKRQARIIHGLRTWYCIYLEDREKRHNDRARLKKNNKMLKELIRHHKIDMPTEQGTEDEWSDLDEENDVFASDAEDDHEDLEPAAASSTDKDF